MRKFAIMSFSFAAAVLLFSIVQSSSICVLVAAAAILCGVILLPIKFKTKPLIALILFSLAGGMIWSVAYLQIFTGPAKEFAETNEDSCAFYVTDFSETTE